MTLTSVCPHWARFLVPAAALALLAACASVPPPVNLMQRAQQQLEAAQKAQAANYAPVDFGFARKRYQAAQAAMAAKKYDVATDMANESLADGRLAQTRAELAAVRKHIQAQQAENARLQRQLLGQSNQSGKTHNANGGLPGQIVLPQAPAAPASAPAPATTTAGGSL